MDWVACQPSTPCFSIWLGSTCLICVLQVKKGKVCFVFDINNTHCVSHSSNFEWCDEVVKSIRKFGSSDTQLADLITHDVDEVLSPISPSQRHTSSTTGTTITTVDDERQLPSSRPQTTVTIPPSPPTINNSNDHWSPRLWMIGPPPPHKSQQSGFIILLCMPSTRQISMVKHPYFIMYALHRTTLDGKAPFFYCVCLPPHKSQRSSSISESTGMPSITWLLMVKLLCMPSTTQILMIKHDLDGHALNHTTLDGKARLICCVCPPPHKSQWSSMILTGMPSIAQLLTVKLPYFITVMHQIRLVQWTWNILLIWVYPGVSDEWPT